MATATRKRSSSTSRSASGTDALSLLKHDHDEVKKLFGQFEKASSEAKQGQLCSEICTELTIHSEIEEQDFYPEVRRHEGMLEMVLESLEEHRQVKELVEKLKGMQPGNSRMQADMKVLKDDVEHHVQEEEKTMFPKVKKAIGKERLEQLGQILQRRKSALKGQLSGDRRIIEEVREPSRSSIR
jgi:hemerythrin superfamily protein